MSLFNFISFTFQLDFVEFATALGIMIRGSDDAKLELAFKILTPMRSARRQEKLQQDYETFENGEFKIREATGCSMLGGRILSTQPAATIPAVEINKASESLGMIHYHSILFLV